MTSPDRIDSETRPRPSSGRAAPAVRPMSGGRKALVYGVLVFLLVGHLYDISRQYEHWPFSNYPMWSRPIDSWDLTHLKLVGVTDEPTPREVPLPRYYFDPLPSRFMDLHLQRVIRDGRAGSLKYAKSFTSDYLTRYEQRRQSNEHDGPKLKGLRIYEIYWLMDHDASNKSTPSRTTLLYDTDHPDDPIPAPTSETHKKSSGKEADDVDIH